MDRVYFFDLAGAAAGCFLLLAMVRLVGGPDTVIGAAVTFAVAAAIWHSLAGSVSGRAGSVALALALVAFLVYNQKHPGADDPLRQGAGAPGGSLQAVERPFAHRRGAAGDGGSRLQHRDRRRRRHRRSPISISTTSRRRESPRPDVSGAGAAVRRPPGGEDADHRTRRRLGRGARASPPAATTSRRSRSIRSSRTRSCRSRFAKYSNHLYFRPDVHLYVEDGRSFVRRSTDKYQVMQATLVDTWASTAAGAFALSENNLYTSDAFRDYLTHLTDDGVLAFTRWGFDPPRESLRLISLAHRRAARSSARSEPWRHVIVSRAGVGGRLGRAGYGADRAQAASRRGRYRARAGGVRAGSSASHLSTRAARFRISFAICC